MRKFIRKYPEIAVAIVGAIGIAAIAIVGIITILGN